MFKIIFDDLESTLTFFLIHSRHDELYYRIYIEEVDLLSFGYIEPYEIVLY